MMKPQNGENTRRLGRACRRWGGLTVLGSVWVLGVLTCARYEATGTVSALQIVQVQTVGAADCVVAGSPTPQTYTHGTFDVYLPDGVFRFYFLPVVVTNNLDSIGGTKATEMNNIVLSNFSVELSAPGVTWTSSCPATFDTDRFTRVLAPGGGSFGTYVKVVTPFHAQCLLEALPASASTDITLSVTLRAKGDHGGTAIKSAPFSYSIDVCAGCLQKGYRTASLARFEYPNYAPCAALTGTNPYAGNPCLSPGEDEKILCCGLPGGTVLCPAVPTGVINTDTSTSTATSTNTGG